MSQTESSTVRQHRTAGKFFTAQGIQAFARDSGEGETVVCMHGVPASSFLYRKVIDGLAAQGMRAVSWDLPGLGLSERPQNFEYTSANLARFSEEALAALTIDEFHLVVHDLGVPVGLDLAEKMPDRVKSLTILNGPVEVDKFKPPWTMSAFKIPLLGELWLKATIKPAFIELMYLQGIKDRSSTSREEVGAYHELLLREDGGSAFLKIMRSFETTSERTVELKRAVQEVPYPVQIVWGDDDPAHNRREGEEIREIVGVDQVHYVAAKHFLQEDQASKIVEKVAALAQSTHS